MNLSGRLLSLGLAGLAMSLAGCEDCPESFGPKGSRSLVPNPPPASPPNSTTMASSYDLECCGGRGRYDVVQGYSWGKVSLRWSSRTSLRVLVTLASCVRRDATDCALSHGGQNASTPDSSGFYRDEYTVFGQGVRLQVEALNEEGSAATLFLNPNEDEGVTVSFGEQCSGFVL